MSVPSVTLTDAKSGSSAKVLVGFGFNCYAFQAVVAGKTVDVLFSVPNFESGKERPSGSGIPLLFPFPGRITKAHLNWEGKEYSLPPRDADGNAIHGFVHERPWRVLQQTANQVTAQFQASVDDPALLALWPADFRITGTYELTGAKLSSRFVLENPDSKPLPCGFGTHPYFRVPLGGDDAASCVVQLPVTESWEAVKLLPTGRRLPIEDAAKFHAGLLFDSMKFDNAFTGLRYEGNQCQPTIRDPRSGLTLAIRFDRSFRECVVYNPPHRQAVCIEPLTCVPGAIELQQRGIDAGLWVLAPGERKEVAVEMELLASERSASFV